VNISGFRSVCKSEKPGQTTKNWLKKSDFFGISHLIPATVALPKVSHLWRRDFFGFLPLLTLIAEEFVKNGHSLKKIYSGVQFVGFFFKSVFAYNSRICL
jgi:hypothetical protein